MKLQDMALLSLMGMAGGAQGAGYALIEQNASGLGNAYAGQAAVAQDASTVFFNPAGLTSLQGQEIVVAGHLIRPSAEFSGTATPTNSTLSGGNAGQSAFLPNFYYAMAIKPGLAFGLGVNAPFGLTTKYDTPWAGMTQAVNSQLKTINLNASVGWDVTPQISLGFGLNWQTIDASLSKSANAALYAPIVLDGKDAGSLGWNAGLMYRLDEASRLGLAYRSEIKHELTGDLSIPIPMTVDAKAEVTLPATLSISYFRHLSKTWDVLADVTWTGWSSFDKLSTVSVLVTDTIPENWNDTWRYSLGANMHTSDTLTWRLGLAYDQTPVPDVTHRTPRIPDEDRIWLAFGAQYRLSEGASIDAGYAHLFVRDAQINHTEGSLTLTGKYENTVDILSVQYRHRF